jgi:hypothetical protein
MLYDLEDPSAFVMEATQALAGEGVWMMELHYLPTRCLGSVRMSQVIGLS